MSYSLFLMLWTFSINIVVKQTARCHIHLIFMLGIVERDDVIVSLYKNIGISILIFFGHFQ